MHSVNTVNTVRTTVPDTLPPSTFPVMGPSTEYLVSPPLLMPYDATPRYQFGSALAQSSPLGLRRGPHGVQSVHNKHQHHGHHGPGHLPLKQQCSSHVSISTMENVHGIGNQNRSPMMRNESVQQYTACNPHRGTSNSNHNSSEMGIGNAFHSKLQCPSNGNGNGSVCSYGHHRMIPGAVQMQCSGCGDKQRLIDNLQREITILRQQYQVPHRHELVHNQPFESSTVSFPRFPWPQTDCDQRLSH